MVMHGMTGECCVTCHDKFVADFTAAAMYSQAWPAILEDSEDSSRGVATQIQEKFRDASESQGVECIGRKLKVTLVISE